MPQFSPAPVVIPSAREGEAQTIRLEDPRGLLITYITKAQSAELRNEKRAVKLNRSVVRMIGYTAPSSSNPSPTMLTGGSSGWRGGPLTRGDGGDMHKVAGTAFRGGRKLPKVDRERLIGYGFAL